MHFVIQSNLDKKARPLFKKGVFVFSGDFYSKTLYEAITKEDPDWSHGLCRGSEILVPILVRAGFRIVRQVGSHVTMEHILDKTRKVTILMHPKPLAKRTLFSILKQAGFTLQEFLKTKGEVKAIDVLSTLLVVSGILHGENYP